MHWPLQEQLEESELFGSCKPNDTSHGSLTTQNKALSFNERTDPHSFCPGRKTKGTQLHHRLWKRIIFLLGWKSFSFMEYCNRLHNHFSCASHSICPSQASNQDIMQWYISHSLLNLSLISFMMTDQNPSWSAWLKSNPRCRTEGNPDELHKAPQRLYSPSLPFPCLDSFVW